MAGRYVVITKEQMDDFLLSKGFSLVKVENTRELVYAKFMKCKNIPVSLRVYSSIDPNGFGRKIGSDAIRIQFWWKQDGVPIAASAAINIKRIVSWRLNLAKGLIAAEKNFKVCPACGAPLMKKVGIHGSFWGCAAWLKTKCSGKPGEVRPTPLGIPK